MYSPSIHAFRQTMFLGKNRVAAKHSIHFGDGTAESFKKML